MQMVIEAKPVVFIDRDGKPAVIDLEMIKAHVPEVSLLDLEAAARVANYRDEEETANFLLSVKEAQSVHI